MQRVRVYREAAKRLYKHIDSDKDVSQWKRLRRLYHQGIEEYNTTVRQETCNRICEYLPRELRDLIYFHLFSGNEVRVNKGIGFKRPRLASKSPNHASDEAVHSPYRLLSIDIEHARVKSMVPLRRDDPPYWPHQEDDNINFPLISPYLEPNFINARLLPELAESWYRTSTFYFRERPARM